MKKLMIIGLAAATMLTGCTGSSSKSDSATDSLSTTYGEMVGAFMYQNIKQNPDTTHRIDSKEFMKGVSAALMTDTSRSDYMIGMQVGMQMLGEITNMRKAQQVDMSPELVLAAMKRVVLADSLVAEPMMLQQEFSKMAQKVAEEAKAKDPRAIENLKAGEAFINEEMKKDPSIKKTESGLAYKVIEEGATEKFKSSDRIQVIYTGKKIDGSVFDSSNGNPIAMSPSGVVPGFGEALQMMGAGSKLVVYIPANLAYGVEGNAVIGPNETLVFEIETPGLAE